MALQEAWGAQRPRSYGGNWKGFTDDYEELDFEELQEEAFCEGVPLQSHATMFYPFPIFRQLLFGGSRALCRLCSMR